jgi:hypothetical protein
MKHRPQPRRRGRKPVKFQTLDTALKPYGGLLAYLLHRDRADPRPNVAQITKELQAFGNISVSERAVGYWIRRAYEEEGTVETVNA